jgi:RND family efflux transporter MFP subunit
MTKKRIVIVVSIVAVAALLIKGKGLLNERRAEMDGQATPAAQNLLVPVVKAKQGVLKEKKAFLAEILSDKNIQLSTKLAGYVEKVLVEESQKVKKGDTLIHIDAIELRSNIDALNATLKAQESDLVLMQNIYKRNKKLYAIGGLSKEQLSTSKVAMSLKSSAMESTKQKIAQLQHQLSYLQIVAPFDGVVDQILLHEGDLAAVGKPILTMSNKKQKLVFSYTPSQNSSIKKEQDVFLNGASIGYVKAIYPTSKNGLSMAEVMLPKPLQLPSGSSVTIEVLTQEKAGCILPDNTILHKKEGTFVMAYEKGKYSAFKVNVEMSQGNEVLVSPCPKTAVAQASEVRLAQLPAYNTSKVRSGESDE